MKKRLTRMVDFSPKEPKIKPMTNAEKEILRMLTEEFLTPKQIISRRQISKQAFYKTLKSLKLKGALNNGLQKVDFFEALKVNHHFNSNYIRLHGQEFNIKILWQSPIYQESLVKSNVMFIDGHTIRLYKNSIEIYAGEGTHFYAETTDKAMHKSLDYWQRFITRLEHDLNCILIKPRVRNIRLVNQHFARGDSEVYEYAKQNKQRIMIYAIEDGKLAFITDDSFGMKEDEAVHPKTSKQDREAIDKQLNDWRINNPPTNSQLAGHISQVSQNLDNYAIHLKAHVESVKQLGDAVVELTKVVKELKK